MNEIEKGTLYLVPTPIGNLTDVTERSLVVLRGADIIACEDTRHTRILLDHYGIHKEAVSYHEHNKETAGPRLISALKEGKSVAQVSDAGMPVISDPGADLVRLAIEDGIPIVPLPGPNAALTALVASGLDARHFIFIGFLPATSGKRKELLEEIKSNSFTLIFYEAPHRLKETLGILLKALSNRKAVLARELTKKFETFSRGTLEELLEALEEEPPRGEYVVLVEGRGETDEEEEEKPDWREAALALAKELPAKEAARKISVEYNLARRAVYQFLVEQKNSGGAI